MTLLISIYRNGLWLAPPIFFVALILLVLAIVGVVVAVRKSVIVRLPLVERQQVEFTEAGSVILCMEGPMLSRRFRGLGYSLTDTAGKATYNRPVMPVSSSGISKGRRTLHLFSIPQPGRYILQVDRLGPPQPDDAKHEFIFTRPHFAKVVAYILGIIASSGLLILSLVLFMLRFLDKNPELNDGPAASKSPLVVITWIAAVVVLALIVATWTNRSHRNSVRSFALAQGWAVSDTDTFGLGQAIEALFPDRTFTCSLIMTVETDNQPLYLIDGTYHHRGPKADAHLASACLIQSDRLHQVQSRIEIGSKSIIDKAFHSDGVAFDDSEFTRRFIVVSDAASYARSLINPAVQKALVDYARRPLGFPVEIVIAQERMGLISLYADRNESWRELVKLATEIESAL
jgi:hypothetical protein